MDALHSAPSCTMCCAHFIVQAGTPFRRPPPLNLALGITAMNISPRHLAASWYVLLSPIERAREQLESMFVPGAANREFFVWLVIANFLSVVAAVAFWFKRAASYPLSPILVCVSVVLLVWALWWSDATFVLIYALGCIFSIWSWRRPNPSFKRDALTRAP